MKTHMRIGRQAMPEHTQSQRACIALAIAAAWLSAVGQARAAEGAPQKVTVRAVAHFDSGKAAINGEDRSRLLAEVGAMKDVTWQTVTAIGHTDSVGPAPLNEALARRRAGAVRGYLMQNGLPPSLLHAVGKGESAPAADNATAEGRAKNRRAEVVFEGVRMTAR
jgi:OOP family OmpA-OmpF porin